jgi:hypothetical protein
VDDELVVVFGEQPAEVLQHKKDVYHHTVKRREGIVRGRLVEGVSAKPARRKAGENKEREELFLTMFGDIRLPSLNHFENGCCVDSNGVFSREQCVQNMHAAITRWRNAG